METWCELIPAPRTPHPAPSTCAAQPGTQLTFSERKNEWMGCTLADSRQDLEGTSQDCDHGKPAHHATPCPGCHHQQAPWEGLALWSPNRTSGWDKTLQSAKEKYQAQLWRRRGLGAQHKA